MSWWERNNLRLIQNNLRETDAGLDVDLLINQVKELSANSLMLNTGGISAFYPTELEFHYKNPYLKGDLIGEAIEKCHKNDIRFIARFDFSKAHESIYEKRPQWFYKSLDDRRIFYNGVVTTCVNGGYQREYILDILGEVLDRYPVDGIFFNMFGYAYWDYSGNYYGICQCDSCKAGFEEMFNARLPQKEDMNDPVYLNYLKFKKRTVRGMLDNIHCYVKNKNPEVAICTYDEYKVDIVRKESNTELGRPLPIWLYSASENVSSLENSWQDKCVSNCSINAVGLDYRFMGVARQQVEIRLLENIAAGSGLDFCIIGTFEGYPDKANLQTVKNIYEFHRKNEKYFGRFVSAAQIALLKPVDFLNRNAESEYRGIFKMLKELHIPFDVISQEVLEARREELEQYKIMVIPAIQVFDKDQLEVLAALMKKGTGLVSTGYSFVGTDEGFKFLKEYHGVAGIEKMESIRGGYLKVDKKEYFEDIKDRNWVFVDGDFIHELYDEAAEKFLQLITPGIYGPPEKCGGNLPSEYFGAGLWVKGMAKNVLLPWEIGTHYYKYGYEEHKHILGGIFNLASGSHSPVETNAPASVEIFLNRYREEDRISENYLLQLLNLSGFNGTTFSEPLPIMDIEVKLGGMGVPIKVMNLWSNEEIGFSVAESSLCIRLERLERYAPLLIQFE